MTDTYGHAPAGRLRAAADLIERTAAEATPGPWGTLPNLASGEWPPPRDAVGGRVEDPLAYAPVADRIDPANAAWIALLSPDTAPTLAAWLRATVYHLETFAPITDGEAPSLAAVAFADLILRDQP